MPQMVDAEHFATVQDDVDRAQPPGTEAITAYFVFVLKLSDITADILRDEFSAFLLETC